MSPITWITMSRREVSQIPVFESLKARTITQPDAAKQLRLTIRQVKRKLRAYRREGPKSLPHRLRGRPSNHATPDAEKDRALAILRKMYPDFGPTFAAEKLAEEHRLVVHPEVLRRWMTAGGLWRVHGGPLTVHVWRERKASRGEMTQADGSDHAWFEDRGPRCTLLAFIDDATSALLWLEFVEEETTAALMTATWDYLERAGRPLSLYVDRHSIYRVNIHNADGERMTQFSRAMSELDVELIHARSPQAKGRVERLFGTLQDRLVKELRLQGISTLEDANRFVRDVYLPKHNAKFAVAPKSPRDLHRSLRGYALSQIFCHREERVVKNDFTLQYQRRLFQLSPRQSTILRPGDVVTVSEGLDGSIALGIRAVSLRFHEIAERPSPPACEKVTYPRVQWTPPADHPWRQARVRQGDLSIVAN